MSGSNLILPRRTRQAQMSTPIVFWYQRKTQFIMCPPSPIAPAPSGFEKIECRHALEVEKWSQRLRAQEKRMHEMTETERFEYEGKIQSGIIEEMEACLARSTDPVNKQFMAFFIAKAKEKREQRRMEVVETFMHCEANEGVAS
jgi:hypothetical protein